MFKESVPMSELYSTAPKTLIVSRNMVEADDLTEMLTGQGLGPVVHVRDLEAAERILESSATSLELMMFGLSMHLPETKQFLLSQDPSKRHLLVIDGPVEFTEMKGAGVIPRPFSTKDVMAALKRLGLSIQ